MSRVGKKTIPLPQGVDVKIDGQKISVKGPKGNLDRVIHPATTVKSENGVITVLPVDESYENRKFHGLTRSLVNNMIIGVSEGFTKTLTLVGVGYRAAIKGNELNLSLGYSHPIDFPIPEGLDIKVDKQTSVIVSGCDKEKVGQTAANIRAFRKPEPYHGKGVRYADERIITKAGKSAGKK
ncbi:MAG: 50S ribosomal protein L6 [Bdellovibrionota bacterium]